MNWKVFSDSQCPGSHDLEEGSQSTSRMSQDRPSTWAPLHSTTKANSKPGAHVWTAKSFALGATNCRQSWQGGMGANVCMLPSFQGLNAGSSPQEGRRFGVQSKDSLSPHLQKKATTDKGVTPQAPDPNANNTGTSLQGLRCN